MQLELPGTDRTELPEHDILARPSHIVSLRERRRLHENVDSFFEAAAHERTGLHAVDAVSRNRHQVTTVCHHFDENREMSVVHVRTVELNHTTQLTQERIAHRFDAKNLNHFNQVVRCSSREVDVRMCHDFEQVDAFGVQHPLGGFLEELRLAVDGVLFGFADENLLNVWNTAQCKVAQHLRLETLQEYFVLGRGVLVFHAFGVHDSNSQHQLFRVVVVEDAAQVAGEIFVDSLRNIRHEELLVYHHLTVKLDTQQPWGHARRVNVFVWHFVVRANEFAVFLDDSVRGIWIVVNLGDCGNAVERGVL